MMRTLKTNIRRWKVVALAVTLPLVFFFIACQDQVGEDVMEITRNSSHALIVPASVQNRYEQLKKENPGKNYALLELNETATEKLDDLQAEYGLPKSIEVFKTIDGIVVVGHVRGEAERVLLEKKHEQGPLSTPTDSDLRTAQSEPAPEGERTFAILEFNDQTSKIAEASKDGKVFTVVEHQPEFPGGYGAMMQFLKENIRYPADARTSNEQGTVYVSFIVNTDGSVSDIKTIRGVSPQLDAEALRVMKLSPNWTPGKQSGQAVRVRFVLPIKFSLG